jgi:fatty acid desaturase
MSEDPAAKPARRVTDVLSADEIRAFTQPSDWAGLRAVAASWLLIGSSFWLVAWQPGVLTIALALVILGGRHLGLAILMHEASHRSLFATRALNDIVGKWLCAAPEGNHLDLYRKHHLGHHSWAGSDKDPDMSLIEGFPVTTASLLRKFARDLSGITGFKRVYGMLAMDFGYIEYTAAKDVTPIDQTGRTRSEAVGIGLRAIFPALMTNTLMLIVLAALGHPWLYLLWVVSYLTTYSLFLRVRSIAEHVACNETLDPFLNTRTTQASVLARLSVAPHRVNYHLEHHLLMTAPYHQLPQLHRVLRERGALEGCHLAPNYGRVLRLAVGR